MRTPICTLRMQKRGAYLHRAERVESAHAPEESSNNTIHRERERERGAGERRSSLASNFENEEQGKRVRVRVPANAAVSGNFKNCRIAENSGVYTQTLQTAACTHTADISGVCTHNQKLRRLLKKIFLIYIFRG